MLRIKLINQRFLRYLFSQDAFIITRNTILYNLAFIILGTIVSIIVAILMCELGKKVRVKFFQASLLLPNLLSWVVIGFIGFAFLNSDTGFINNTVIKLFGGEPVSWYTTDKYWPFILIIVYLWKNAGYNSIIYMASISGIDKSIYEAAKVDASLYIFPSGRGCNCSGISSRLETAGRNRKEKGSNSISWGSF